MDTQKTVRKYLWYDLIANLCFGLVAMINNLSNFIKTDELKTIVSTAGLINVIIFVTFTVKGRRLMNKYYNSELNSFDTDNRAGVLAFLDTLGIKFNVIPKRVSQFEADSDEDVDESSMFSEI